MYKQYSLEISQTSLLRAKAKYSTVTLLENSLLQSYLILFPTPPSQGHVTSLNVVPWLKQTVGGGGVNLLGLASTANSADRTQHTRSPMARVCKHQDTTRYEILLLF